MSYKCKENKDNNKTINKQTKKEGKTGTKSVGIKRVVVTDASQTTTLPTV